VFLAVLQVQRLSHFILLINNLYESGYGLSLRWDSSNFKYFGETHLPPPASHNCISDRDKPDVLVTRERRLNCGVRKIRFLRNRNCNCCEHFNTFFSHTFFVVSFVHGFVPCYLFRIWIAPVQLLRVRDFMVIMIRLLSTDTLPWSVITCHGPPVTMAGRHYIIF